MVNLLTTRVIRTFIFSLSLGNPLSYMMTDIRKLIGIAL